MENPHSTAVPTPCRLTLQPRLEELSLVPDWLNRCSESLGLTEDLLFKLNLCIEEGFANLVLHGAGVEPAEPVQLDLHREASLLILRMTDRSRPFDPTSAAPPPADASLEDARIGGQGIHLMKSFSESWTYEAGQPEGNILTLRFR